MSSPQAPVEAQIAANNVVTIATTVGKTPEELGVDSEECYIGADGKLPAECIDFDHP